MTLPRAIVFNTLFYGLLIAYMLVFVVILVLPGRAAIDVARTLMRNLMRNEVRLQRLFGLHLEVRGLEHVPAKGGLIACKHQSMWETFSIIPFVWEPAFVYKQELGKIPLFGNYLRKVGMIPIDRGGGSAAVRAMAAHAREAVANGRQIIIFPEGTRRPPGAPPAYKGGIAKLYGALDLPVTPAVLNSGLFWSSYFWKGKRGTIVIEFLPPIPPGLEPSVFLARLQETMEAASDRLMRETSAAS